MVKNQIKKVPIKNRPGPGRDFFYHMAFVPSRHDQDSLIEAKKLTEKKGEAFGRQECRLIILACAVDV